MSPVHFLHIPKTGGTAVATSLARVEHSSPVKFHDHFARLVDIPVGEKVIFMVRDPVTRFVSGFNSRLRKGLPRNKIEWSAIEQKGFAQFPVPNALAEALSADDHAQRAAAIQLIRGIFHLAVPLSYWLGSCEDLRSRADDIIWIMLQNTLSEDFQSVKSTLGIRSPGLPDDMIGSHRTPQEFDTALSAVGEANVRAWYAGDFPLFNAAIDLREMIKTKHSAWWWRDQSFG